MVSHNTESHSLPNYDSCELSKLGKEAVVVMNCIYIGLNILLCSVGALLMACAWYVYRAKPAKDLRCGLQVKIPRVGWLNFGVSGEYNANNAKDHPATGIADGRRKK